MESVMKEIARIMAEQLDAIRKKRKGIHRVSKKKGSLKSRKDLSEDRIDSSLDDSFPASDPPANY